MSFRITSSIIALAALGALSACNDPKIGKSGGDVTGALSVLSADNGDYFKALSSDPYVETDGTVADLDAAFALLPEGVSADYASVSFDEATGATLVDDLTFLFSKEPEIGFSVDELKIWDFDSEFLTARLEGERLDETGSIFSRFDASGMKTIGLEQLFKPMLDSYENAIEDEIGESGMPSPAMAISKYDFTIDRIVMSGLALGPYSYTPFVPGEDSELDADDLEGIHIIQQIVAGWSTVAMDGYAAYGMNGDMVMSQFGEEATWTFDYESTGARGVNGFDYDFAFNGPVSYSGATFMPDIGELQDAEDMTFKTIPIAGKSGLTTITDMKLNKAAGYLARMEMPDMSVRDLMSPGIWTIDGMSQTMDGKDIFSMGSFRADLTGFSWFLPTDIDVEVSDFAYNVGNLIPIMTSLMDGGDGEAEMMATEMNKAGELLKRHDLDVISLDGKLDWLWDADTGPATVSWNNNFDDILREEGGASFGLPVYDQLAKASKAKNPDRAFQKVFDKGFSFSSASLVYTDSGFFDRLFPLVSDIGKTYVEQNPDLQMIANMEPEQMRTMAASFVGMAGAQVSAEVPQATDWLMAVSNFIKEGGVLSLSVQPDEPLTSKTAKAFDSMKPEAIVEMMNITVEHTAP